MTSIRQRPIVVMHSKVPGQRREGKQRSRCNAVRHGLTAETVVPSLGDSEDYAAFEAAVISDYDAESAVERELVLRLAGVLWRLRRVTSIETTLFDSAAEKPSLNAAKALADRFLRLAALPTFPLDRLSPRRFGKAKDSARPFYALCAFRAEVASRPEPNRCKRGSFQSQIRGLAKNQQSTKACGRANQSATEHLS
jgi:hypothetical protein